MQVSYSRTVVLSGVILGLIGCSVAAPPATNAPNQAPAPNQAQAPNQATAGARHVLELANPAATLAQLREALPAEISAADAARLLVHIDPSQVVSHGSHFGLQATMAKSPTSQAPFKPVHGASSPSPTPKPTTAPTASPTATPNTDVVILASGFSPFFSSSLLDSFSYYPYGNYYYPYYNYGGSYYPYTYNTTYDYLGGLGYGGLYGGLGTYSPYGAYDYYGNGYGYPYYGASSYGYSGYPFLYNAGNSYYPYSFASNTPYAYANSVPVSQATVAIQSYAFQPTSILVRAGGTVTWTNQDPTWHSVTPDIAMTGMSWPGDLATGQSKTMTFSQPGYYRYHCRFHPTMTGMVIVQ